MKTLRMTTTAVFAIVLGLAVSGPTTAHAQEPIARFGTGHLILASANTDQHVRVTIGHPALLSQTAEAPTNGVPPGTVTIMVDGATTTHEIAPGEFFTYTIDPRVDGRLIDPRTGRYIVPVEFDFDSEAVEGDDTPTLSILIEVVNFRTGEVQSAQMLMGYVKIKKLNSGG